GGQLVARARRELERTPPDHARALELLEQAYAEVPSDTTKELLERTRKRAAETRRDAAARELAERVRAAEAALERGDPDAAVKELQAAASLVKDGGAQDPFDVPRRLAQAEAASASRAARAALPAVDDEATAAEVEHALEARRRYLDEHSEGFERAEVE